MNLILNVDGYKPSQFPQYPPKTTHVSSYIEARGGDLKYTIFNGLQGFVKEYLLKPITQADIDEAEEFFAAYGEPFHKEGWQYILEKHNGFIPVRIEAVKEGTKVFTKNCLLRVENTDPKCYWVTSYIETALLRAIWYPTTVATISHSIKQIIKEYLIKTGDVGGLLFKLHDFGARGVSSFESAAIGGCAHLINFMGSDTISGILHARKYYGEKQAGFSIPAGEHSTYTSWGRDRETDAYENMIKLYSGDGKTYAVVSDSYNLYYACEHIFGEKLKQLIIDSKGTLVIRPDSGDPVQVLTGTFIPESVGMHHNYPARMRMPSERNTPEEKGILQILGEKFGYTVNAKGYKVLNTVRVIWGDGINENSIRAILAAMEINKWSADNIAFGMGGALLQQLNRDTQKWAMKCSSVKVEGEKHWRDVFKDPITDQGKQSKRGRQMLYQRQSDGLYFTNVQGFAIEGHTDAQHALEAVYEKVLGEDVKLLRDQTFTEVREISNRG